MKSNLNNNLSIGIVAFTIGTLLFHHFFYFYGHFGFDDMHYARLSHQLLQGNIDWSDHYSYRFTILSLTALSYSVLGINDFASGLPAMLLSLGIVGAFYSLFSKNPIQLITALALYFSYKWNLFYSDKLMPDLYVSFFSLLGWYGYYRFSKDDSRKYIFPIVSAVGIFLAFNSKGTIVLLVPLFAFYLLKDLIQKSFVFWKAFLPTLGILLLGYIGLIKYYTGSALSRFDSILSNKYVNDCSYDQLGLDNLLDRLGPEFLTLIATEGLYVPILIVIGASILMYVFPSRLKVGSFSIWTILILILSANFMTISPTSYNPICIDPRHIMFITPIIAICAANIIGQLITSKVKSAQIIKATILIGSFLILIPTWKYAQYCKNINYSEIRKNYLELAQDETLRGKIICSPAFKNYMEYYSEFDVQGNRSYHSINEIDSTGAKDINLLVAVNWYADWHSGMDDGKLKRLVEEEGAIVNEEIIYSNNHIIIHSVNTIDQDIEYKID